MTDYLWPTSVIPARSEIMLRDLSSRFSSPFTGTARTYQRPGGELRMMRLEMPPMVPARKAALTGLLSKLRGGVHRVWCKDHSYVKRGSFPATEMVYNNTFANGAAGWAADYSSISVADNVLRLVVASHSAGQYPAARSTAAVALESGKAYVARSVCQNASDTSNVYGHLLYNSATARAGALTTTAGMKISSVLADAAGISFDVRYNDTASTGDTFDVTYTSVSRCALVKGASQTVARILIDALPTSTDGLLLEGDQVQIGEELFTVAAALNSNSSGEGYLTLHRPPRAAPADNAPVIIHEPMGLFMLAENENGWQNVPGRFANASVSLIEAVR